MNSTYSFFDRQGIKSFHYNTQAGMWFLHTTDAENARREKFTEIYMDEFAKYEAENGKVVDNRNFM